MVIIGGGTGGLCLAQALRKAGLDVAVYERSASRTERLQGYLLHITPWGARILQECLPEPLWRAFRDTCGLACGDFGFVDEQLVDLARISDGQSRAERDDPRRAFRSVSRITLHELLGVGLSDVVSYGKEFTHYTRTGTGRVSCHFADGTSVDADLVIGADGADSRVRAQYLPAARRVDTGITVIAGKLPLTGETRAWLPERLLDAPNNVLPPGGSGMFIASHDLGDHDPASYLMWVHAATSAPEPDLPGEALRELVAEAITGWHPTLRRLVADTPAESVAMLPIVTSVQVPRWQPTNITLLGDAIHSMTPFRGIGANIALRDASVLATNLISVAQGRLGLLDAIDDYERQMTGYGFAAVRESLRAARAFVSDTRSARTVGGTVRRFFPGLPAEGLRT
ncbi:MAG TPA: NAD(P)/FAD-dependent oxidoreductase [Pseudonocardiaceae bacterium]|jgi:2-polyprenyl-6-methoxyphenol hydroxylase-like FAD-dependent oxidoreductase